MQFGERSGRQIALETRETSFTSHGTRLVGRLVMPPGDGPVPIVVLLHGAEFSSARDSNSLQRMLPAAGIGAFVYDKRGTGASGDRYTQVFRSEEHTSELQSLMRISYAVFCLKKKNKTTTYRQIE